MLRNIDGVMAQFLAMADSNALLHSLFKQQGLSARHTDGNGHMSQRQKQIYRSTESKRVYNCVVMMMRFKDDDDDDDKRIVRAYG